MRSSFVKFVTDTRHFVVSGKKPRPVKAAKGKRSKRKS
jgi:hypothetical protein